MKTRMVPLKPPYVVYILECGDASLYTGITTDVQRRFSEHTTKKGGRYTRSRKVIRIVYTEKCADRSEALKREAEIKKMSRKQKLALLAAAGAEASEG